MVIVTSEELKSKAAELGYLKCGFIPAGISDEYNRRLDERAGTFPESKALYESLHNRPPAGAKSIIVCTVSYAKYRAPEIPEGLFGKFYLFDCRLPYAYENRAKAEFETYMKTNGIGILHGYVPVRLAAAKAGIGKFGRNNFIYDSECGSYIWIDAWFVDAELEYDAARNDAAEHDAVGDDAAENDAVGDDAANEDAAIEDNRFLSECCSGCLKCVKACPTKALSGGMSMDRGLCVTHLTCNAKDALDAETRERMGTWLYGCDACQDACPVNQNKRTESEDFPLLAEHAQYLQPKRIFEMDESVYENIVNPRFWYIGKDKLWLWKCNALRAMINAGDAKYRLLIKKSLGHEDARVREVAAWGCEKLGL